MKVFIYRNLNRVGHTYSIKVLEGPLKNRVVGYANGLLLENCQLVVSQTGRNRVLRTKRKNVHAGIVGELIAATGFKTRIPKTGLNFEYCSEETWLEKYKPGRPINYNPYVTSSFVYEDNRQPLTKSEFIMIINGRVEAYNSSPLNPNFLNTPNNIPPIIRQQCQVL